MTATHVAGLLAADDAGEGEEDDDQHEEHDRGTEGAGDGDIQRLAHAGEHEQRQRQLRTVGRVVVELVGGAGDQQDRRGLADHPGDAEQDRGDQAGAGGGQHHSPYGLPLGGAEGQRGLPQAIGHQPEHHLGRGDDHRDHAHAQGHGRGETTALPAELDDDQGVDEQACDDRRHGGHRLDDDPHQAGQPAAHLAEVHGCGDAQGHADDHRDGDLLEGADHRGEDAALVERGVGSDVRRGLGVEVQVLQGLDAADSSEHDDPRQRRDQDQSGRGHQRADDAVHDRHSVQHGRADRGQHHQEGGVAGQPEADRAGDRQEPVVDQPRQCERAQAGVEHVGDEVAVGATDAEPFGRWLGRGRRDGRGGRRRGEDAHLRSPSTRRCATGSR